MKKGSVLLVDDDKNVLRTLEILLNREFEKIKSISNPNLLPSILREHNFDVILLDMNFSAGINTGNEGLFWLKEIQKYDPDTAVILITAFADVDLAVKAIKNGALDFVLKPWNNEKLIYTLKSAVKLRQSQRKINQLNYEKTELSLEITGKQNIMIGNSPPMKNIFSIIEKVAATDANVLILGENGTGKELIARELHLKSKRARLPMIGVDFAALSESLFESELFGHLKGSFTDASEDRIGRFEIASGGTLFIDEIGNMPLNLQSKILAVLQNREIVRIGSNKPVPIDIRLVSATNRNLEDQIRKGLFREDLYYRLNTICIELPPLRERGEDILKIAEYYLGIYGKKYDKPDIKLSQKVIDEMFTYSWPGNVRELRHCIEKAVILADNHLIQPNDLMLNIERNSTKEEIWPLKFEDIERKAIIRALENNKGKLAGAARELGLTRQTLHNKVKKYGL